MKKFLNKIIGALIISDFFFFFAVGLLAPIFAVFILENIENKIEVVGYATAFYWISRLLTVIPLSHLMDKIKGEVDEHNFLVFGTFLISVIPLFYLAAQTSWHIYLLQIINGFAYSMAVPAWRIIFTNNLDRRIVGLGWSLEDVSVSVGTAASAALGALIVGKFGFKFLFIIMFVIGFANTLFLFIFFKVKKSKIKKLFIDRADEAPLKINELK